MLLPILLGTTILCRSTGALALLVFGMIVLWLSTRLRTRLLLAGLLLGDRSMSRSASTICGRANRPLTWPMRYVGHERAQSLEYRFKCERLLIAKAVAAAALRMGRLGAQCGLFQSRVPSGGRVPTDGLWIIFLGTKGFVGSDLFIPGPDLAGGLVRLAISARLVVASPGCGPLRVATCCSLCTLSTA